MDEELKDTMRKSSTEERRNKPVRKPVGEGPHRRITLSTITSGVIMDTSDLISEPNRSGENVPSDYGEVGASSTLSFPKITDRKISHDATPHIDNYRAGYKSQYSVTRPTLTDQFNQNGNVAQSVDEDGATAYHDNSTRDKFGWIEGVLIRNMMSIWGVMLFLRLTWVVGEAGIGETLIIIAISTFITLVTALSMSAISTNGEIGGGGTYFVMSRVLGPEFGGSIGIIFAIANAMDCSLNVVGFAHSVQDMMKEYGGVIIVDGGINDIRIIGTITLLFISAICGLGAKYETKMKDVMFVIMLAAFTNFITGSIMGPTSETEEARGFIGYSSNVHIIILRFTNIKGFCTVADNSDLQTGTAAMLGLAGIGKVKPNILMMGFKNNWSTCDRNSLDQYVMTIHTGFEMQVAVAILRLKEGLDCTDIVADFDDLIPQPPIKKVKDKKNKSKDASIVAETSTIPTIIEPSAECTAVHIEIRPVNITKKDKKTKNKKPEEKITLRDVAGNPLPKSVLNSIVLFQRKQKKDTIDVWWLSDDGGLTLLLPVIINSRSNWSETKLRIFCTASGVHELEREQIGMAMLLSKFRIDYSDLVIITDVDEPPKSKTKKWFDGLIRPLLQTGINEGLQLTDGELEAFQYKTDRYLRLRELLLDHSSDSNLVFMTLPVTRKGAFSAPLYMAWLEALTANMPPFVLIRGNQTSVLTFYS